MTGGKNFISVKDLVKKAWRTQNEWQDEEVQEWEVENWGQSQHQQDLIMGESSPDIREGKRLLSLNHIGLDQAQSPYKKSGSTRSQQSH